MKKLLLLSLGVLLKTLALGQANASGDCMNAISITENHLGPISLNGKGSIEEVSCYNKKSPYFFEKEHNTAWFRFKADHDFLLTLELVPLNGKSDLDFLVFKYNGEEFCTCMKQLTLKPVRSNLSHTDSSLAGRTGLSADSKESYVSSGLGNAYSQALSIKEGEIYYLVIDNYSGIDSPFMMHTNIFEENKKQKPALIDAAPIALPEVELKKKVKITVDDYNTKQFLNADISIDGIGSETISINDTCCYDLITKTMQTLEIKCALPGYFFSSNRIVTSSDTVTAFLKVHLKKIMVGENVTLKQIKFEASSAELLTSSKPDLIALYKFMNANPNVKIEIQGHVNGPDSKNTSYAKKISKKRAKAVYDYLVLKGISKKRLRYVGKGNAHMLYPNPQNEDQNEANRRVDIKIISNK